MYVIIVWLGMTWRSLSGQTWVHGNTLQEAGETWKSDNHAMANTSLGVSQEPTVHADERC